MSRRLPLLKLLVVTAASFGLFGCGGDGSDSANLSPEEAVNIRFQNDSSVSIETLWLGGNPRESASTFRTRFVDIAPGEVSGYLPVEANRLNYDRADITNGEQQWLSRNAGFDPLQMLGVEALSVGTYYTFTIDTSGSSDLVLTDIRVDPSPPVSE